MIDGDVDGDLVTWSQVVIVNGHVKGDISVLRQELRVNGTVDGNVRAFAEITWTSSGAVGRNLMTLEQGVESGPKRIGGRERHGRRGRRSP